MEDSSTILTGLEDISTVLAGMEDANTGECNRVKMKKTGRVVGVYDGRRWPVVHCGNVIVSPEEKVSDVKSSIVSGNISKDKRKKSSKYALAVASSFGHVHAFLQDEEYVLDKIDTTPAEDKCLMLIKKPKSSSRKMFKSQSWANLSLSDSHLYSQPNYNTEGRQHKYRMKRKPSDLQTVPSESMMNLTGYGMRVDSYIPQQRDIKHRDTRSAQNRFSGVTSPQSCHSEDLPYRNGNVNGYQPEINNNKLSKHTGNRMYSSHMDIYRTAPNLSYIKETKENCVIRSDEMYSDKSVTNGSINLNDPDSVSRAHSVGDLSTGLTFSVVGQRKDDSSQCLSALNNSTFKPVSQESGKVVRTQEKTHPVSETRRKESARKCIENKKDLQNTLRDLLSNIQETKDRESARSRNGNTNKHESNTPMKPKRALPSVPQGQADDRKKHYTEMMKMRMSQHSRSGQTSSSSSSVRTVQETPLDKEVSELFGNDRESCPGMLENVQNKDSSISHRKNNKVHHDTLNVSIPSSVRSCDSGQATITSLSSTVDSGYLTNDAENDMYSTTSYTKCLQKSAQNLYSKKAPVVYSQNIHKENVKSLQNSHKDSAIQGQVSKESTVASLKDNTDIFGTHTFPRSSHSLSKDQPLEMTGKIVCQETSKSKLISCDKPVKYSSMKQLPTSDLSSDGGQRLQTRSQGQSFSAKIENDRIKQMDQNEITKSKIQESTQRLEGEVQTPVIESHYNTLPGNWKFQSKQSHDDNDTKRIPSLHQLSQTYQIIPVTLQIGLEYNILDHLRFCESCVMLQNSKKTHKRESTAMSPPQGKYARLGGPGSAFKPVKVSDTSLYSVITVQEVFHHKTLQKGDVILEVNQKIVLGEPVKSVETLLSGCHGEVLLTVARTADQSTSSTQTANQNSDQSAPLTNDSLVKKTQKSSNLMDSQLEHLKKQVAKLNIELKRKNKAIRELNSLLPWRPNDDKSEINGNDEITLNGLSEDEFIV